MFLLEKGQEIGVQQGLPISILSVNHNRRVTTMEDLGELKGRWGAAFLSQQQGLVDFI